MACESVETPLQRIERGLHSWVAYMILPLFALANSGLVLGGREFKTAFLHPVTLGIVLGLVAGKPLGIALFILLAVKLMRSALPTGVMAPDDRDGLPGRDRVHHVSVCPRT